MSQIDIFGSYTTSLYFLIERSAEGAVGFSEVMVNRRLNLRFWALLWLCYLASAGGSLKNWAEINKTTKIYQPEQEAHFRWLSN